MATTLAQFLTGLEETWSGLVSVCSDLSPEQWEAPTELPGWSVKDVVSHVVGVELLLEGEPFPDHELPADLPHVRNDAGRWTEVPVAIRRPVPGAAVLDELREVTARRLKTLRALDPDGLDVEVLGVLGRPMRLQHLLGIRVFDSWVHEQDVRRALGRPGGLDSSAAAISRRRLLLGMAQLPLGAGRTLAVVTTAPDSVATITFGASYADVEAPDADARIATDFETFVRLGTGRVHRPDAVVAGSGDQALVEEFLRTMVITP